MNDRFSRRLEVQREDFDQWQNYGQSQAFPTATTPWTDGQSRSVLRWQQATAEEPIVHTIMLAIDLSAAVAANHTWRWSLQLGVGGSKRRFLIDALGAQQISVPVSTADIDLLVQSANPLDPFSAPNYDVNALAYIATHTTASRLATLTQWITVGAAGGISLAIPVGANAWKLLGIGDPAAAGSPFVATFAVTFDIAAGLQDSWLGSQLLDVHSLEDHLPIPGAAKVITLNNAAGVAKKVAVQWGIDF